MLPFLIADPVAFYDDTIKYGAGTYKIVGYGLSAIMVRLGILEDRDGSYPFALVALLTWAAAHGLAAHRPAPGRGALGGRGGLLALSLLWLLFIGRTFNNYYLVWPMTAGVMAALMAVGSARAPDRPRPG